MADGLPLVGGVLRELGDDVGVGLRAAVASVGGKKPTHALVHESDYAKYLLKGDIVEGLVVRPTYYILPTRCVVGWAAEGMNVLKIGICKGKDAMTDKQKTVTKIIHKVYELTDGGTLREPTELYYGRQSPIFSEWGYDTMDEALEDVARVKGRAYYVILALAGKML